MSAIDPRSRRIAKSTSRSGGGDRTSSSGGPNELVPAMQRERAWALLDGRIDHALELTFPASDPPAWQGIG
jgi:hypothetical protein